MREIERIVETYSDTLLRLAMHHVNNLAEAQDVVQDVYLKYMKKHPAFNDFEHERAWLMRVCITRCKDYHRHWWQLKRSEAPNDIKDEDHSNDFVLLDEVKKLNFHERNAIYLYYYEQYSVKEIAAIFETKENTVSSWLHRARKQLKEQLKGGWDDEE